MITTPDLSSLDLVFPPAPPMLPLQGGLQFKDAAPMICGVVDNGVSFDDPRVMVRLNEATKIVLDALVPVGGMMIANVTAQFGILVLPPQMENVIEAHPLATGTKVFGDGDITQSWYEIVNNSTYMEPDKTYDNPLVDLGLNGNPSDPSDVRRVYNFPGLEPSNAVVQVSGAKRYLPIEHDEDYLIIQNIEALKLIILSIERYENNAIDDAAKYRQTGLEMFQAEIKKHIFDPRNYMYRKAQYYQDLVTFAPSTLGWTRAQMALDMPEALRMGKTDLTWGINQCERRLMERGTWKDTIITIQAQVVGGILYFPLSVAGVYAVDLNGNPIPIRSQFFQHLDNGPGGFPCSNMLIDQGDKLQPGFSGLRRRYKLIGSCTDGATITAVCKLRWIEKKPADMMVIKNYEAVRLMMIAKSLEEKEDWKNAQVNQQQAIDILEKELQAYLGGIRHTVHIQTYGFGLGDVGDYWTR
jgi:hypothetical protein